jgi:hypothetical protein
MTYSRRSFGFLTRLHVPVIQWRAAQPLVHVAQCAKNGFHGEIGPAHCAPTSEQRVVALPLEDEGSLAAIERGTIGGRPNACSSCGLTRPGSHSGISAGGWSKDLRAGPRYRFRCGHPPLQRLALRPRSRLRRERQTLADLAGEFRTPGAYANT